MMLILRISFLAILLPVVRAQPRVPVPSPSHFKCLPRFQTDRAYFNPCLNTVCFIFVELAPYITLDVTMKTDEDSKLFPCKNWKQLYPNLRGPIWKIHAEINFDALCIWGGPKCTFDENFKFIDDRASHPDTKSYQFGVTGPSAQLPSRMTNYTKSTVTILEIPVILIKSIAGEKSSLMSSFHKIGRAFEPATWAILFGIQFGLFILAYLVSIRFTGYYNPADALLHVLSSNSITMGENCENESLYLRRTKYKMYVTSMKLISVALGLVIAVTVVFYEVAEVNFIFKPTEEVLPKPLTEFSDEELSHFATVRSSGFWYALAIAVDPNGTRFPDRKYPWYGCYPASECYRKLIDPQDKVNYMATVEASRRVYINHLSACHLMTVVNMPRPLYVASSGWYLSSTVPDHKIRLLNQQIMLLKTTGLLYKIVDRELGKVDPSCGRPNFSISPPFIWIPIAIFIGPMVLAIIGMVSAKVFFFSNDGNSGAAN